MLEILYTNNHDLFREIEIGKDHIESQPIPSELEPYKEWLLNYFRKLETRIQDNFYLLSLEEDDIFSEIYSWTLQVTKELRVLNSEFLTPLYRYNKFDNLCLKLLKWLHDQHLQSKDCIFALSHGDFAITAHRKLLIYALPSSSRQDILHLPLFFHEYGHYLFSYHEQEMIELIADVQKKLQEEIVVPFQENNARSQHEIEKNKIIIETWYSWMEELFCDAIGLHIGGISYLHTFSLYLRTNGNSAFYYPEEALAKSSHPVSWLRVIFLVERAKKLGFVEDAQKILIDWENIAGLLGINQNYHGYYRQSYKPYITKALDDMLEEANPISFRDYICNIDNFNPKHNNFIELANWAWQKYFSDVESFIEEEKQIIEHYKMDL
jgi:hypothetical protein